MDYLLRISAAIDCLNQFIARWLKWVVLIVVVISAGNAISRKFLHISSNAWLEVQWYLFGAIFLLAGGYALLKNEHVRVDILYLSLSERKQAMIEIFGVLFYLLSASLVILYYSWPFFYVSFASGEMSSNSGGLIRWPAKLLIPVGFTLLILASISHLIKCVGFLMGKCDIPTRPVDSKTAEEALAEEIAARAEQDLNKKENNG